MLAHIVILLSLLHFIIASPTGAEDCTPVKEAKLASHDDLPFTKGSFNPIPPHYYGLSYFTFQVDQYDGWMPPALGSQWTMAFGGSGNISIPDQPPNQTFALESFSYACVSGVPQAECAVSVWGWKASGNVIKRVIKFPSHNSAPNGTHVMNATSLSRQWTGLKSLGFSIARADDGGDMDGGLALEDLKYTVTTPCWWKRDSAY